MIAPIPVGLDCAAGRSVTPLITTADAEGAIDIVYCLAVSSGSVSLRRLKLSPIESFGLSSSLGFFMLAGDEAKGRSEVS